MDWLQVTVRARVQGVTAVLPISNSAHRILPGLLTAWPDQGLALDVAVHPGMQPAVIACFRARVTGLPLG